MCRRAKFTFLLACFAVAANAVNISSENFKAKPAKEGWFIGTGVGTQFFVGDSDNLQSTGYRFSTSMEGIVGKWITPSIVGRLQGTYARVTGGNIKGKRDVMNMVNFHADCMVDALNLFMGVDESRKITVLPYIGLGAAANVNAKTASYSINVGATALFRVDEHINLFTELKGSLMNDKMDNYESGLPFDGSAVLTAGFLFKF